MKSKEKDINESIDSKLTKSISFLIITAWIMLSIIELTSKNFNMITGFALIILALIFFIVYFLRIILLVFQFLIIIFYLFIKDGDIINVSSESARIFLLCSIFINALMILIFIVGPIYWGKKVKQEQKQQEQKQLKPHKFL